MIIVKSGLFTFTGGYWMCTITARTQEGQLFTWACQVGSHFCFVISTRENVFNEFQGWVQKCSCCSPPWWILKFGKLGRRFSNRNRGLSPTRTEDNILAKMLAIPRWALQTNKVTQVSRFRTGNLSGNWGNWSSAGLFQWKDAGTFFRCWNLLKRGWRQAGHRVDIIDHWSIIDHFA